MPLVDPARFLACFNTFSAIGGLPNGGLDRPTLSDADKAARDLLAEIFKAEGFRLMVDAIGNMFGILDLAGEDAPAIMTGSHLDSQPTAGRFDGQLGVVAGLQAAIAVRDACKRGEILPTHNLVVVNWTNEEGARFQPSLLGSGVYTGQRTLEESLRPRDQDGRSVAEELARIAYAGSDADLPFPAAYLELHIEQSTVMEKSGQRLGAFIDQWGAFKFQVAFHGRQAHTGPTAMEDRRDAMLAAGHLITAVRGLYEAAAGTLYTSVARLEIDPNSPNTVPSLVIAHVELRSPDAAILETAEAGLMRAIEVAAEAAGVTFELRRAERRGIRQFSQDLFALAEREAAAMGERFARLHCATAHDGSMMTLLGPALVLTIPCRDGITHHPDEFASDADMVLGTEHLARMLSVLVTD
ncbi:N-carbamoyl-L-amino-acid hydrolase [Arboricoccus pini]|uniref:N-carbamoyl-L-amino-acid hydrolase n=1 Tax=Arboricoccus pini TaxID=1963835 RepID=A0A212S2X1_9PROT|nr:Zn-dependent hydrolase [Arboricoccus pini]SNB79476.1 N-carbamoyl-L-amino-acid hydrolase [Arboricoccus pini]